MGWVYFIFPTPPTRLKGNEMDSNKIIENVNKLFERYYESVKNGVGITLDAWEAKDLLIYIQSLEKAVGLRERK